MPDRVIYKACGNRRASVCPSCAEVYRADAYQLVLAGLQGGKGVPDTVSGHPAVFATLTAPGFGVVHTQRKTKAGRVVPCRARRRLELCPHGVAMRCHRRHKDGDRQLGQPLCADCYDYDHHAVWNNSAGELWRLTTIKANRLLARHAKAHGDKGRVRLSFGKVAEYQTPRRGPLPRPDPLRRARPRQPGTGRRRHLRGPTCSCWPTSSAPPSSRPRS